MAIWKFRGDYFFLSNFYECSIIYKGYPYRSVEAAFQAQKCPELAYMFCDIGPKQAKKLGRQVDLRSDWEQVKLGIMHELLLYKFSKHPDLRQKLQDTGEEELFEGSPWAAEESEESCLYGDNTLGKLLMQVRSEIANAEY